MKAGFALLLLPFLASSAAADPACGLYQYKADITKVYDGDTITADIDLGFNTWRRNEHLRMNGIDAPEVKGDEKAEGIKARDALAARILDKTLMICTIKDKTEKFGRYLVNVYIGDELVNDWMVAQGYAVPYYGGPRD
jgi:micrococcal nuclease